MALTPLQSPFRRGTVILIVLLGTYLSFLSWQLAGKHEEERVHAGFLSRAQTQATVADQRLRNYEEMVYGIRDSFLGQNIVTREEFNRVAQAVLQRHTGVQALEWVQIVPHQARAGFEQQATRELKQPFVIRRRFADGTMRPAPEAPEYFVISYVEPLAGNELALGYDITSAPSAPLLAAARTDRQFKVSQTFRLVQSSASTSETGVIFILPFARSLSPESPVEGFIQGVFHVQTLLAHSHLLTTNEALDTYYFDMDPDQGAPILLYANLGGAEPLLQPGATVVPPSLTDPADFHHTINAGNRQWRMIIRKNAAWAEENLSQLPTLILAAGLAITTLLALFINNLLQRTDRIEREVRERTRQLRETEARLQDIMDHSPAIIFMKDLDGRYLMCNQAFEHFSGLARSEILGRFDADLLTAEDALMARSNDAKVLAAGKPIEFEETTTNPANNHIYLSHKFPIRDAHGRIYATCGISTDITDRKAAEEQKLVLERQILENQKLESLGVLAGGIAHDFNNILTAILGNATLAAMDLPEDHRARRQLRQIEHAARRAGDLCAQMLAYAGKGTFVDAPLNLTSLVRDTAALLEVTVGKRAHLALHTAEGLPAVMGDITQLRQVVMNLVMNASDSVEGRTGAAITLTTFRRDLPAEYFRQAVQSPAMPAGDYVGLEVSDNGCGMAPEVMLRIFEPFFTTKFSGRGLGLAAVLGIIRSHKGALFVESTAGQGTTFRIFLPASATRARTSTPPFDPAALQLSLRGTVLLVDDEDAVRQVTTQALASLGLTVLVAPDGQTALRIYRDRAGEINLVLLDLTMPGLTGEETLRQLREVNPAVRVIIMSGYSESDTLQRCGAQAIAGYLPKPFELAELVDRLKLHLA